MMKFAEPIPIKDDEKELAILRSVIKKKIGFNCDEYKQGHLKRRLAVRLRANNSRSYKEYADFLIRNESELHKLKDILTVNVTELFRNPETYEAFSNVALPELIRTKAADKNLNVWSAGCSNGEEPYSIAIMIREFLGASFRKYDISILGTDIDEDSLRKAERGVYCNEQLEKISRKRLESFFIKNENNSYRVSDEIRRLVKFKHHDLISGTRLSGFDIIFCRNVTIYFEQKLQERLYLDFYNALNEGGYFVMGKTETLVGPAGKLFKQVDAMERIYKKESIYE